MSIHIKINESIKKQRWVQELKYDLKIQYNKDVVFQTDSYEFFPDILLGKDDTAIFYFNKPEDHDKIFQTILPCERLLIFLVEDTLGPEVMESFEQNVSNYPIKTMTLTFQVLEDLVSSLSEYIHIYTTYYSHEIEYDDEGHPPKKMKGSVESSFDLEVKESSYNPNHDKSTYHKKDIIKLNLN